MVFASNKKITPKSICHRPILGDKGRAFLYYKSPKAKTIFLLSARS